MFITIGTKTMSKYPKTSFQEWTQRFGTERACLEAAARVRWRDGFRCPRCGHDRAYVLERHAIRQCRECAFQASPTAGTLFENTRLPLTKWFAAIYLATADKGGISAERLRKMIGVTWRTAQLMLDKIRRAMADRDRNYVLGVREDEHVELDDAFVGGRTRGGKRGRGAEGKRPVLVAVEHRSNKRAGFLALKAVDSVDGDTVRSFRSRLGDGLRIRTDGWKAYGILNLEEGLEVESRATPAEAVDEWLPKVHTSIANLKRFLLGTFHGVSSPKLQKYLDEFVYRHNRRFWEPQLPHRLLAHCANHRPEPKKLLYTENGLS